MTHLYAGPFINDAPLYCPFSSRTHLDAAPVVSDPREVSAVVGHRDGKTCDPGVSTLEQILYFLFIVAALGLQSTDVLWFRQIHLQEAPWEETSPWLMLVLYASVNQVSIGSDNGLAPIWRQAIV